MGYVVPCTRCEQLGPRPVETIQTFSTPKEDRLRQALAAAEAECAASRVLIITGQYHDDYGQAMQANDATRARLGLGRIGEAR
jgi:hypothetical protein